MATRQETQNKRRLMRESIIEACRTGEIKDGDLMPPVRDLARQYGLSTNLAGEVIQALVAEGVLHARPGAGTIAGNPRPVGRGTYLFLLPERIRSESVASTYLGLAQRGFEVGIAGLGGACLTLELDHALQYAEKGELPELAGIFSISPYALSALASKSPIPAAFFGDPLSSVSLTSGITEVTSPVDSLRFDDVSGGKQATQHLLASGFESIAYLALHAPEAPHDYIWSAEREAGWREAMVQAGKSSENLAFHPLQTPSLRNSATEPHVDGNEQMEAAREAIEPMLTSIRERQLGAVVATNLYAAQTLFAVLKEQQIAKDLWPAVVCFDSFDDLDNNVVSAMNLPWDEVGKAGAQLLWERHVGRLRGANSVRMVPMQLIPRLTCRPDWTNASRLVEPHLEIMAMPAQQQSLIPAVV